MKPFCENFRLFLCGFPAIKSSKPGRNRHFFDSGLTFSGKTWVDSTQVSFLAKKFSLWSFYGYNEVWMKIDTNSSSLTPFSGIFRRNPEIRGVFWGIFGSKIGLPNVQKWPFFGEFCFCSRIRPTRAFQLISLWQVKEPFSIFQMPKFQLEYSNRKKYRATTKHPKNGQKWPFLAIFGPKRPFFDPKMTPKRVWNEHFYRFYCFFPVFLWIWTTYCDYRFFTHF